MRLINFRHRGNFKKSIFPLLNPFGKMVMLDMLNSTVVKEPDSAEDGRIICNYGTDVAEGEGRYWSFSTVNSHMTKQFQIYRCLLYTSDAADERSSVDL